MLKIIVTIVTFMIANCAYADYGMMWNESSYHIVFVKNGHVVGPILRANLGLPVTYWAPYFSKDCGNQCEIKISTDVTGQNPWTFFEWSAKQGVIGVGGNSCNNFKPVCGMQNGNGLQFTNNWQPPLQR